MTEQEFGIKSAQLLRPFAHEFGLEYYPVDELTTILIGNGFALWFGSSYEYTPLSYWRLYGKKLLDYSIHDYLMEKSSDRDREGIVWEKGCFEYAYNEVQLFVNTLRNQWRDLLKGSTRWMWGYRFSEDWHMPELAHGKQAEAVKEILLAQKRNR